MTGAEPAPAGRHQGPACGRCPTPDRQPPHNLEAEEAVLGAVLASGRLLAEVAALLEEADFYRPAHRAIWRAMLRLADRGQPTDPVTVLGELDDSRRAGRCGRRPVPPHPGRGRAHRGQRRPLRPAWSPTAARRRRVIDLGIRWPTPTPTRPCSPTWPASWPTPPPPTVGAAGRRPSRRGRGEVPAFPVEVLPGWLGEYVAAVATATQTPPDLAGMLALAVLATVAAGAVEVEPRPGWREPLCLFVAVGMDAGARKSSVFTALTRPVADFERDQAAAALPGDHRDRGPAPDRRPGRRHRRGRRRQGPGRPAGGGPGRGDRPGRRGLHPGRAAGAAVAGR